MNDGKMEMLDTPHNVFSQGERLKGMGLKIPQITQIVNALADKGYSVEKGVLTIEEAVKQLLPLLNGGKQA